ncbi:MAG: elongation factor P maturation arginine rhamnosyltransferase EarP [Rubrivivax sp.]
MPMPNPAPMRWDLFCRVVDNFGDIGVCWRLAHDLAGRGDSVRLWVDDPAALAWMAPEGAARIDVVHWHAPTPAVEPADVVVEAFGCELPAAFVERMAQRAVPPLWINLEYLSAQDYVQRSHGLLSPQTCGPGRGLRKWFFYPGFTVGTGGLLREPALMAERQHFDAGAWLRARGLGSTPGERVVSLFCYDGAPVPKLLERLSQAPTLLLLTPGAAQRAAHAWLAAQGPTPRLRCIDLPWFTQPDFDRLLWACDLNFVRGEDSFVRAMWAGAPFVWQAYPQPGAAQADKLDAYLGRFLDAADPALCAAVQALWQAWNGLQAWPGEWPSHQAWSAHCVRWRGTLLAQADLVSQLQGFVHERR